MVGRRAGARAARVRVHSQAPRCAVLHISICGSPGQPFWPFNGRLRPLGRLPGALRAARAHPGLVNIISPVLIVVPTYNEARTLHQLVETFERKARGVELLVVDDASPDGTGALADRMAATRPWLHVLHRSGKDGLGNAYRAGFAWGARARLRRHRPARRRSLASAGAAAARCSRRSGAAPTSCSARATLPGGGSDGWPLHRRIASRIGGAASARGARPALHRSLRRLQAVARLRARSDRRRLHALAGLRVPGRDDAARAPRRRCASSRSPSRSATAAPASRRWSRPSRSRACAWSRGSGATAGRLSARRRPCAPARSPNRRRARSAAHAPSASAARPSALTSSPVSAARNACASPSSSADQRDRRARHASQARDPRSAGERRIGAQLEREHRRVDRRGLDLAARERAQRVVVAARAHPDVAVGIDAELAQRVARQHPARERVVAVVGHARAAQLLGRRRATRRARRAGRRGRTAPSSSSGTGAASGSMGAPASRMRVYGRPHTKSSAGGPATTSGRSASGVSRSGSNVTPVCVGDGVRDGLVVRSRDLAEEAVDGERRHPRRVARRSREDAHVHVVVVADERLDDARRAVQREVRAHEDELGMRRQEEVEQVLRERDVDLLDRRRRDLAAVACAGSRRRRRGRSGARRARRAGRRRSG